MPVVRSHLNTLERTRPSLNPPNPPTHFTRVDGLRMCEFYGFRDRYKFRYPQWRRRVSPPPELIQPTDPRPPKFNISDFGCLKVLGEGATSKVLLVRSLRSRHPLDRNGSLYALKTFTRADVRVTDKVNSFHFYTVATSLTIKTQIDPQWKDLERSILTKLPWNPFVAGIIQVFKDEKNLYTLMEYIPCGSLRSLLQHRGPFDATSSAFYFCNIAAGLEFLEDHNIYHRDLKPENILLGADGYLVITDFGEGAHLHDYENTQWEQVGSPAYSAPELLSHNWDGERVVFSGVDWWSAGVILYEMTYKKLPFWGRGEFQVHQKKTAGVIHWRREVEVENLLKGLISGLLTLDTTSRLGANGAGEVMSHSWLKRVEWSKIKGRTYLAPYVPSRPLNTEETWHRLPLPSKRAIPGLGIVKPCPQLSYNDCFPECRPDHNPDVEDEDEQYSRDAFNWPFCAEP